MIFNIGLPLFQWDSGQYLLVNGLVEEDGTAYAHFQGTASTTVYSLAVEDGKVQIPNILLQTAGPFRVYGYALDDDDNGKTLVQAQFNVIARPQPPEYIYDPTPVITYPELVTLVAQMNALKSKLTNLTATVDANTGTPSVEVTETATGISFDFHNLKGEGGGGGTENYNDLLNKPKIANTELSGNKSYTDLGIMPSTNPKGQGNLTINGTALSSYVCALGQGSYAGSKAFTISAIDTSTKKLTCTPTGISVGDNLSMYISNTSGTDTNFDGFSTVTAIGTNDITVSALPTNIGTYMPISTCYVWVIGNPNIGDIAIGNNAVAMGYGAKAQQIGSFAEGYDSVSAGKYSHAEGRETKAIGYSSHAEGRQSQSRGVYAHAEGQNTRAKGQASHSEGRGVNSTYVGATGDYAHTEGYDCNATNDCAHSEGLTSVASGNSSHCEGADCKALGSRSHAEGEGTIANRRAQHTAGRYNVVEGTEGSGGTNVGALRITGNGTSNTARKDAEILTKEGHLKLAGGLNISCTNATNTSLSGGVGIYGVVVTRIQTQDVVGEWSEEITSTAYKEELIALAKDGFTILAQVYNHCLPYGSDDPECTRILVPLKAYYIGEDTSSLTGTINGCTVTITDDSAIVSGI